MIKKYTNPIRAVMSWVTENVIWNTAIFPLKGLSAGINAGSSQREMVSPMKAPFNMALTAAAMTRQPKYFC